MFEALGELIARQGEMIMRLARAIASCERSECALRFRAATAATTPATVRAKLVFAWSVLSPETPRRRRLDGVHNTATKRDTAALARGLLAAYLPAPSNPRPRNPRTG